MKELVLFWIFVGFFVIIGIISILTIVGIIKTEKRFRNWSVAVFAASIVSVVVMWAKAQPSTNVFVNLIPPNDININEFELVSGTYEYSERTDSGKEKKYKGTIELTAAQQIGWWTAKIPYNGSSNAIKLLLEDKNKTQWCVYPFYPNYTNQQLRPSNSGSMNTPPETFFMKSAFAQNHANIKFSNYAKINKIIRNKKYYRWKVFMEGPAEELSKISEVQYLLHPSFPNPLQIKKDSIKKFALEDSGWGTFQIGITVKFKDNSIQKTYYQLDLNESWPVDQ
jgi:hypothetical protein